MKEVGLCLLVQSQGSVLPGCQLKSRALQLPGVANSDEPCVPGLSQLCHLLNILFMKGGIIKWRYMLI